LFNTLGLIRAPSTFVKELTFGYTYNNFKELLAFA
jgi:hypothetical protein